MLPCLIKVRNLINHFKQPKKERTFYFFSPGIQVSGTVPGSIYTDLEMGGKFTGGPLLFRFNDLDYRWVSYEDWDYYLSFEGFKLIFLMHGFKTSYYYYF